MKVLIPDLISSPALLEKKIFGSKYEVIAANASSEGEIDKNLWASVSAILAFDKIKYDKNLISKLRMCKVIVRVGVGYDNIDLKAAKEKNIVVCNVPDYGVEEVADHTMSLLLALTRGLKEYSNNVEQRNWKRENALPIRLRNKYLGIIGLGRTGTATAIRAKSFGINILFYDPYLPDGIDKSLGFHRVRDLHELAKKSNFISIHTPANKETLSMLDEEFFLSINKGCFLINTARGGLIDLDLLKKYIKNGTIAAAGLDVLPIEPNIDTQSMIVDLEKKKSWITNRLIVTPHIAFYSPESLKEMRESAASEALRVLNNETPRNKIV